MRPESLCSRPIRVQDVYICSGRSLKDCDGQFERWTIPLYRSSRAMGLNVDDSPRHAKLVAHARYNLLLRRNAPLTPC